ncbi:hypothetical protein OROGR_027971 [Orobanche gracilis]
MAAVAPSTDLMRRNLYSFTSSSIEAAELLQKLSLDSQIKTIEIPDATKKASINSSNVNGIQSDRTVTPILPDFMDPTICYVPSGYPSAYYYSGGFDGSGNDWDEYTRYLNSEGVELTAGVYGDNGSLLYHHGYGYAPYSPYSPAATPVPNVGHDGQLYGAQPYQYPTPYFQSLAPTSGPYPTPAPAKGEVVTSAAADQAPLSVDSHSTKAKSNGIANSGGAKGNNGAAPVRATYQNSSFNMNGSYGRGGFSGGLPASAYQDPRYGFDGYQSPIPWLESPYFTDGQHTPATTTSVTSSVANGNGLASRNQNFRPHLMGLHHPRPMTGINTASGYLNRMYPNKSYGQYGSTYRCGLSYGANGYDTRSNGRGWMAVDSKYKPRGRGNGCYNYTNESIDGLNELNRGPRSKSFKNPKNLTPAALAVKLENNIPLTGTNDNEEKISSAAPDHEQYNRPDFPGTCADAKFFIIKSYSEDDVHKSIKYNVWASTPNGNKKLDAAYLDAQQKSGGCPIFLLFSVNTSGQFLGVAEMIGPVDFDKSLEYWQQDKWIGCFPVKWHIVKDVPNSLLKHITLENNENKPVTNSRDIQEVKLDQGLEILKIFQDHTSKQCILDDFDFYEDRQKKIQDKKAKLQNIQKQAQVWEGKPIEENKEKSTNSDIRPQNPSDLNKEVASAGGGGADINVDSSKSADNGKSVISVAAADPEKKVVVNGC